MSEDEGHSQAGSDEDEDDDADLVSKCMPIMLSKSTLLLLCVSTSRATFA